MQRARLAWMCDVQSYRCRQLPMLDRFMRYLARVQSIVLVLYACGGMTADEGTIQKLCLVEPFGIDELEEFRRGVELVGPVSYTHLRAHETGAYL
eukprot:827011-Pyramimonas_sp.AAC.1